MSINKANSNSYQEIVGVDDDCDSCDQTAARREIEKDIRNLKVLNYLMSVFSGMFFLITYSNLHHVKQDLQIEAGPYTEFDTLTKAAWILKPLLGYVSECFFPFKYRIKTYVAIMTLIMIGCCLAIFLTKPGFYMFGVYVFGCYFAVGFIDTVGEGMTAIITKKEALFELMGNHTGKKAELELDKNKKAIGNFMMFKMFVRSIAYCSGGILADLLTIGQIYMILAIFPTLLLIWTLFFFKEERKEIIFVGWNKTVNDLVILLKAIFRLEVIAPLAYVVLMYSCPNLGDANNYILVNMAAWNYIDLSWNYLAFGAAYSLMMLFVLNKVKGLSFESLLLYGGVAMNLSKISNIPILFAREVPYFYMFNDQWIGSIFQYFASDMPMIATIGKFSNKCPDGMESTGITLIVSISNIGNLIGGMSGGWEVEYYGVKAGYYDRIRGPFFFNWAYAIAMVFLCPFFAIWKS